MLIESREKRKLIPKVKFTEIDPKEVSNFLKEWELQTRENGSGWIFMKQNGQSETCIVIDTNETAVQFFKPGTGGKPYAYLQDVNEVEFDYSQQALTFTGKSGDAYLISEGGRYHSFVSKSRKLTTILDLEP